MSPVEQEQPGWAGIALAGPPGSGKRTVAFALSTLGRRYARLPALTTARTSTLDTEHVAPDRIAELRAWAQVFHHLTRDGAVLVYDRQRLHRIRDNRQLAVVTVDSTTSLRALARDSPHWLTVRLHCPFDSTRTTATRRQWAHTHRNLAHHQDRFTLAMRTDQLPVLAVAQLIHHAAQHDTGGTKITQLGGTRNAFGASQHPSSCKDTSSPEASPVLLTVSLPGRGPAPAPRRLAGSLL